MNGQISVIIFLAKAIASSSEESVAELIICLKLASLEAPSISRYFSPSLICVSIRFNRFAFLVMPAPIDIVDNDTDVTIDKTTYNK